MPWTGRILSALAVLFLVFDATLKVIKAAPAMETTVQLGYPASVVFGLGLLELACVIVYVIPATSVLGAILLTGYLGGAVATHVRVGSPLLGFTLFPVYVGLFVWGGLLLRDSQLRAFVPLKR